MIERMELEPTIIAEDVGISIVGYTPRLYKLNHGDIFTVCNVASKQVFGIPIRRIKLGEKTHNHFIFMEKIKRKHWWQFWKPKYTGVKVMYVEKENKDDV